MISWFTENPTPLLVIGGFLLLALGATMYATGRGVLLVPMGIVAAIMASAVLIDYLVVTDRERVASTIYDGAKAFEANDLARVQQFLSATAPPTLRNAPAVILNMVTVEKVNITNGPEIKFNNLMIPPTATAEFVVVAQGKLKVGETVYSKMPRRVVLRLRQEGDRWLVYEAQGVSMFGEEAPAQ